MAPASRGGSGSGGGADGAGHVKKRLISLPAGGREVAQGFSDVAPDAVPENARPDATVRVLLGTGRLAGRLDGTFPCAYPLRGGHALPGAKLRNLRSRRWGDGWQSRGQSSTPFVPACLGKRTLNLRRRLAPGALTLPSASPPSLAASPPSPARSRPRSQR